MADEVRKALQGLIDKNLVHVRQTAISLEVEIKTDGKTEAAYLHRGIAARAFFRTFVLADGMEVTGALLEHGLLHIEVSRLPPAKLVKRIPIQTAG